MKRFIWTMIVAGSLAATSTPAHLALFAVVAADVAILHEATATTTKVTNQDVVAQYPAGVPENFYEELGDSAPEEGAL